MGNDKKIKSKNEIKYTLIGNTLRVVALNSDTTFDKIPPAVYSVRFSKEIGYYLDVVKPYFDNLPSKLFGSTAKRINKIVHTYLDRDKSTGVLSTGDKGSGKSLLSELLCNQMIAKGYPVIMVNEPHLGEAFNNFINSLGNCVLLFDEFGKTYRNPEDKNNTTYQDALLTLLDGTHASKRLIIFTENQEKDINDFMLNRPGRIYYHFRYGKLDEDVIREVAKDSKVKKKQIKQIIEYSRKVDTFSFDILKAIIEEHLRFKEPVLELVKDINVPKEGTDEYELELIDIRKKGSDENILPKPIKVSIPNGRDGSQVLFDMAKNKKQKSKKSKNTLDSLLDECTSDEIDNNQFYSYIYQNDLQYDNKDNMVYIQGDYVYSGRIVKKDKYNFKDMRAF